MDNKLILYKVDFSPPVRTVRIVAKLLGLELELRDLDLLKGEQFQESYTKLNPEHTVPTLIDGNFAIWDSHTICAYLVDKYGKDDTLYPKDLQLRARVNQRLFFDAGSLFGRVRDLSVHVFVKGGKEIPQDKIDPIYAAYGILERFLAIDPFLVGNHLTIADVSVAVTVVTLKVFAPLKSDEHPKILAWLDRVKQAIPFFEEMTENAEIYRQLIHAGLAKNKQN